MLRVIPDGDDRYRLVDGQGDELGWIRGRAVRFFGFVTEEHVLEGAHAAWRALEGVLRSEIAAAHARPITSQLRVVNDGACEWISDDSTPIARLFRPPGYAGSAFAIELVVPPYVSERVAIRAAHAMADAVRRIMRRAEPLPRGGRRRRPPEPLEVA